MTSPAKNRAGVFRPTKVAGETYQTFHPKPLPPDDPPLAVDAAMQGLLDTANQALGRLDGVTLLLPDPDQFIYTYVRKEAVLSSQIEGTQSSLSDLLLFEHHEVPGALLDDASETFNYIRAMDHGLEVIRAGRPLSLNLIREVHQYLMDGARGGSKSPGEFRRTQNWLGGTQPGNARYVPPPAYDVVRLVGDVEKFIHDDPEPSSILIKAALAHAQFETIHPFLDGNGRVGRLLITLLLSNPDNPILHRPLLYLSLYLKRNRDEYYERLQRIRTHGEWEEWLEFFLHGVIEVATAATETTRQLVHLVETDRQRILAIGRAAASTSRLHELMIQRVVFRIPEAARTLGLSEPTVASAAEHLRRLGIAREVTGRPRNKLFLYSKYLGVLEEGTAD